MNPENRRVGLPSPSERKSDGENKHYEQSITWLKELKNELDKLPDTKWKMRFGTLVNGLRTELKRKRNFILLLDKHFAGC